MKIATWNVNSIRTRLPHVCDWLLSSKPDVLLLQELKCQDEAFPFDALRDVGYESAVFGQKTYNGVAIVTNQSIEDVVIGNSFFNDSQARVIEAVINGCCRVISVYVPNGESVGSDKYAYKMSFLDGFAQLIHDRLRLGEQLVIGGDFNIAPTDRDVYNPKTWHERILCSTSERLAFKRLINLGLTDALRAYFHEHDDIYTWWDYRSGAFARNDGLRIDHLLISPSVSDRMRMCGVDCDMRARERPSDHAPVWLIFD